MASQEATSDFLERFIKYSEEEEDWDRFFESPKELDSVHTIQYCGFIIEAAIEILQACREHGIEFPGTMSLLDFMIGFITYGGVEDVWDVDHDWDNVLSAMGIAAEAREATLDPDFTDVCMAGTAKNWVKDTAMQRMRSLEMIDERIQWNRDLIESLAQQRPCGDTVQITQQEAP